MKQISPIRMVLRKKNLRIFDKMYSLENEREKKIIWLDKYKLNLLIIKKILDLLKEVKTNKITIYEHKDLHIHIQNKKEARILIIPLKN